MDTKESPTSFIIRRRHEWSAKRPWGVYETPPTRPETLRASFKTREEAWALADALTREALAEFEAANG